MISVIIPTYNRQETIERSVKSVLNQTVRDLECIVVDDGSDDDTKEVIDRIDDPRLRFDSLGKNCGACAARNRGIELAAGEYIAFQDSDDAWAPEKLEVQLKVMGESGADVCFCRKRRTALNGEKSDITLKKLPEGILPYSALYVDPRVSTQTLLARSAVFKEFRFDEELKKIQDYDWAIRAGQKYRFYFCRQVLVDQYYQPNSITVQGEKDYQTEEKAAEYMYQKYRDQYEEFPGLEIALLNRVAKLKVLSGEDASAEFYSMYHLSKKGKDYMKYLGEKYAKSLMNRLYLHRRKHLREWLAIYAEEFDSRSCQTQKALYPKSDQRNRCILSEVFGSKDCGRHWFGSELQQKDQKQMDASDKS